MFLSALLKYGKISAKIARFYNSLFFLAPKSQDLGLQSKNFYATFI